MLDKKTSLELLIKERMEAEAKIEELKQRLPETKALSKNKYLD